MPSRKFAPYQTTKHFVARANTSIASGAGLVNEVVVAVARGTVRTTTAMIDEGNTVKAVHCEYWLNNQAAGDGQFTLTIEKLPSGATPPDTTDMANLQAYENKKNILFTTQGVIAGTSAQSIPVIRDWVMIPKGKQRFGLDDKFIVTLFASGQALQLCGMGIYKEVT